MLKLFCCGNYQSRECFYAWSSWIFIWMNYFYWTINFSPLADRDSGKCLKVNKVEAFEIYQKSRVEQELYCYQRQSDKTFPPVLGLQLLPSFSRTTCCLFCPPYRSRNANHNKFPAPTHQRKKNVRISFMKRKRKKIINLTNSCLTDYRSYFYWQLVYWFINNKWMGNSRVLEAAFLCVWLLLLRFDV